MQLIRIDYHFDRSSETHSYSGERVQRLADTKQNELSPGAILQASECRGRRQRLSAEEEQIILDCAIDYQQNRTPLDRQLLRYLTQTMVSTFTNERQQCVGFTSNRP